MIMIKKQHFNFIFFFIQVCIIALAVFALFFRLRRGVEFTDECWYVAEPFLVSKGDLVPFVNNWTQAPGFTIPLAILFNIYSFFCGTEGIMLFSRVLYLFWNTTVSLIVVLIVRNHFSKNLPVIWVLPFFLMTASAFDITYNSIGLTYMPLQLALIFSDWDEEKLITGFISGVIGARMIIGSPQVMVPCFLLLLLLLIFRRYHLLGGYVLGIIISAVLVIGWCCLRTGVSDFIYGMKVWLIDNGYMKLQPRHTFQGDIHYLLHFLIPAFAFLGAVSVLRVLFRDDKTFSLSLVILISLYLLAGLIRPGNSNGIPKELIRFSWFESFCFFFFSKKNRRQFFTMITVGLYFSVYLFSSFTNIYGFGAREYWLIVPMAMTCLSLLLLEPWNALIAIKSFFPTKSLGGKELFFRSLAYGSFAFLMTVIFLAQLHASFSYIYRDEEFNKLTTKVESGIWKACYTHEKRAKDVVDIEKYIRSHTTETDKVFFLDWASFGYLMSNGSSCTSMSLDPCGYTYRNNDPEIIYNYYKQSGTVPSKIFYIDFGRDAQLSIEDPQWQFNHFVDSYYTQTDTYQNPSFRVLEYNLSDFSGAINYALMNALP